MRTLTRDQSGTVTLTAYILDAASGSGVFRGTGITYTYARTATGTYDIRFDSRLVAFALVSCGGWNSNYARVYAIGAGSVTVNTYVGGTAANSDFHVTFTALDKRT